MGWNSSSGEESLNFGYSCLFFSPSTLHPVTCTQQLLGHPTDCYEGMKDKDFVRRAKSSRNESSRNYQLYRCVALGGSVM